MKSHSWRVLNPAQPPCAHGSLVPYAERCSTHNFLGEIHARFRVCGHHPQGGGLDFRQRGSLRFGDICKLLLQMTSAVATEFGAVPVFAQHVDVMIIFEGVMHDLGQVEDVLSQQHPCHQKGHQRAHASKLHRAPRNGVILRTNPSTAFRLHSRALEPTPRRLQPEVAGASDDDASLRTAPRLPRLLRCNVPQSSQRLGLYPFYWHWHCHSYPDARADELNESLQTRPGIIRIRVMRDYAAARREPERGLVAQAAKGTAALGGGPFLRLFACASSCHNLVLSRAKLRAAARITPYNKPRPTHGPHG